MGFQLAFDGLSCLDMARLPPRRVAWAVPCTVRNGRGRKASRVDPELEDATLSRRATLARLRSGVAAWGAGLGWDAIRSGLASFISDSGTVPGRFNVMDYRGATVIADYGHNPDAMRALAAAVEAMPARRRTVVISGAGDRRDQDIREQTVILGGVFERVVLFEDACQRGRADGEVLRLLREGLAGAQRTREVTEIRGEMLAIDHALAQLEPGDLCLVLIDQVEEALAHLANRVGSQ